MIPRRTWLPALLVLAACGGCSSRGATPASTPSISPTAAPSSTASPTASSASSSGSGTGTGSSSKVPGVPNYDEIIAKASQLQTHGLTQQARTDLVMQHLIKSGRKRMLANWEISQVSASLFEVCFSIAPIDQVVAISQNQQSLKRPSSDPFSRPPKAERPADGIYFIWTVDIEKNTVVASNAHAKALQELAPQLPSNDLDLCLTTPEEANGTPTGAPLDPSPTQGITFVGFETSGNQRVAVVSMSGQYRSFRLGDVLDGRRFSKIGDADIEVTNGSAVQTVKPGQPIP